MLDELGQLLLIIDAALFLLSSWAFCVIRVGHSHSCVADHLQNLYMYVVTGNSSLCLGGKFLMYMSIFFVN